MAVHSTVLAFLINFSFSHNTSLAVTQAVTVYLATRLVSRKSRYSQLAMLFAWSSWCSSRLWVVSKDKSSKRSTNEQSLEQRFQIEEEHERGSGLLEVRQLAEKYACGKTQISNIGKNKDKVIEEYEWGFTQTRKRNRTSQHYDFNDVFGNGIL